MIVDVLTQAQELKEKDPQGSIQMLFSLVKREGDSTDEEYVRTKETAILELGELLAKTKQAQELEGKIREKKCRKIN